MKRLFLVSAIVLAALLGAVAAASCGSGDGATSAGPVPAADTATEAAAEEETEAPPVETEPTGPGADEPGWTTFEVWFADAEGLFVTYQTEQALPRVGTAALEALLAGPEESEEDLGLRSAVPEETRLLGLTIEDGLATVDLTSEFESGGGSLSMQTRLAQIVYTITQFPTVERVSLHLDGEPVEVLGGEGIIIDRPLTRADFEDLLPAILVTAPAAGQPVSTPVVVRGSANVFEANVIVEILDASGNAIAGTFTTATCGSGCRGTYRVRVPFEVDRRQEGTVVVHDEDAAGEGRPPHEVRIPVVLVPGR